MQENENIEFKTGVLRPWRIGWVNAESDFYSNFKLTEFLTGVFFRVERNS